MHETTGSSRICMKQHVAHEYAWKNVQLTNVHDTKTAHLNYKILSPWEDSMPACTIPEWFSTHPADLLGIQEHPGLSHWHKRCRNLLGSWVGLGIVLDLPFQLLCTPRQPHHRSSQTIFDHLHQVVLLPEMLDNTIYDIVSLLFLKSLIW